MADNYGVQEVLLLTVYRGKSGIDAENNCLKGCPFFMKFERSTHCIEDGIELVGTCRFPNMSETQREMIGKNVCGRKE